MARSWREPFEKASEFAVSYYPGVTAARAVPRTRPGRKITGQTSSAMLGRRQLGPNSQERPVGHRHRPKRNKPPEGGLSG